MDEVLDKSTLRLVVAQICHSLGWHSVTRFTLEILTDIIERYLKKVSVTVAGFCQNDGRQSPTVHDVGFVFDHLGISCLELEDYLHQVEQTPFGRSVPDYPMVKSYNLKHSNVDASEEDYYEPHFPPLVKIDMEKKEEIVQEEGNVPVESSVDASIDDVEQDGKSKRPVTVSRKRSYDSPPYSPIEPKRLNLDAQEQVMDLTRPDLKVSTPKELSGDAPSDEHPITVGRPDFSIEKSRVDKGRQLAEKSDNIIKTKVSPIKEKKDSHKKENVTRPPVISSPPTERPLKDKFISNTPPKTPEIDRRTVLSPPKLPLEKIDRSPFSLMPPFGQSVNVSPSPPKHKTSSPKVSKNITSPKTPETSKKTSTPSSLDTSSDMLGPKPFESVVSPKYSPSKSKEKPTKVTKPAKKVPEETKEKKKKKKKVVPVAKEEKVKAPVKLKISTSKDHKGPKVVKEKKTSSSAKDTSTLMSSEIAESSDRLTVPKLVFKPLAYPSAVSKPGDTNSKELIKKTVDKKTIKSSDSKVPSEGKKKLKINVSDVKLKKKDSGKVKDTSTKGKTKKGKARGSDSKMKGNVPPGKEPPTEGIPKCKFELSGEEGIKMSFTTPPMKLLTSPKKKFPSPLDPPVPMASMPPAAPHVEYEPPKKKAKPEKKKKGIEKKETTEAPKVKASKKSKKEVKKETDSKPVKAKKAKKEPLTPAIIQPIPKLTLKMDPTSSSTPNTSTSSKVVIKPLSSPTKSTESTPGKKNKAQSSTVSKAPSSAAAGTPPSSKKSAAAATPVAAPPPPPPQPMVVAPGAAVAGDDPPHRGVFTVTLATTNVATAEVYYCPACQRPDDGSPMIGCDGCDLWYHWPCVGVLYAPKDDEQWFCPPCTDKQKKKKKKKKDG